MVTTALAYICAGIALLSAFFLIRNLAMMPAGIRAAENPEEARLSWRLSIVVTFWVMIAYAAAAWLFPQNALYATVLTSSPLFLGFALSMYVGRVR
ncbi:MAG: hypothetical protein WAO58_00680 [Fimbriimonadaceae bacterium]